MGEIRKICGSEEEVRDEDRRNVFRLVDLAQDKYCRGDIWPMIDEYLFDSNKVRNVLKFAEADSSIDRQEIRNLLSARQMAYYSTLFSFFAAPFAMAGSMPLIASNKPIGIFSVIGTLAGAAIFNWYFISNANKADRRYDELVENSGARNQNQSKLEMVQ